MQFLVSEKDFLVLVIIFDVTQARSTRIAAQLGLWHSEKECGAILVNVIGYVSVHAKIPTFLQKRAAAANSQLGRLRASEKPNLQLK